MSRRKRRLRGIGCGCLSVIVLVVVVLQFTDFGHALTNLYRRGYFDSYINPEQDRKYSASSVENLKSLYTALMLYHESEGQFPQGNGWMDAIKNRVESSDMKASESEKKFVSPSLQGKPGQFGYAMNDAAAGKYVKDIKDPKTPLIFDSSDTSRNAHGEPKKLLPKPARPGGNMGIAVDGSILKL